MRGGEFDWSRLIKETTGCCDSAFMRDMRSRRDRAGVDGSMGYFDAAVLFALVKMYRPGVAVETGTHTGMSSAFILAAMRDGGVADGVLHTIDRRTDAAVASIVPDELRGDLARFQGEVSSWLDGPTVPATIDLFLHDSTHRKAHQRWEFDAFWPRIRSGGLLVSHDVDMNSAFTDFVLNTYVHTDHGQTDWARTSHAAWGRLGGIGFIVKR
jgi:predicted O-methyltransferase YrrM